MGQNYQFITTGTSALLQFTNSTSLKMNSCRSGRAEAFQARERGVSPDVFYTAGPAPSHSHDPVGIMVSRQVVSRGNIQGVDRGDGHRSVS